MDKKKPTAKPSITQATPLVAIPRLTERAHARYSELLEFAIYKFFGKDSVEHLKQEGSRLDKPKTGRVWHQDCETLDTIMAPLQETLASKAAETQAEKPAPQEHRHDMPIQFRARLLTLTLQGFREHCDGCVPSDRDLEPILWLAQDLEFQADDLVQAKNQPATEGGA